MIKSWIELLDVKCHFLARYFRFLKDLDVDYLSIRINCEKKGEVKLSTLRQFILRSHPKTFSERKFKKVVDEAWLERVIELGSQEDHEDQTVRVVEPWNLSDF